MLLWGLLFGSLGLGFFVYGKKQQALTPLICGLGLMVLPYVVSDLRVLVALGILLAGLPYFFREDSL